MWCLMPFMFNFPPVLSDIYKALFYKCWLLLGHFSLFLLIFSVNFLLRTLTQKQSNIGHCSPVPTLSVSRE